MSVQQQMFAFENLINRYPFLDTRNEFTGHSVYTNPADDPNHLRRDSHIFELFVE
jgi:hypothetical protein